MKNTEKRKKTKDDELKTAITILLRLSVRKSASFYWLTDINAKKYQSYRYNLHDLYAHEAISLKIHSIIHLMI